MRRVLATHRAEGLARALITLGSPRSGRRPTNQANPLGDDQTGMRAPIDPAMSFVDKESIFTSCPSEVIDCDDDNCQGASKGSQFQTRTGNGFDSTVAFKRRVTR